MITKQQIREFYNRTRRLILYPRQEWQMIGNETDDRNSLFRSYLIPLAAVSSVVVFLFSFLHYEGFHILLYTFINFISATTGAYIVFFIAGEYLSSKVRKPENTALHLSVYSTAVFILFHSFSIALVNGFWSQLFGLLSLVFLRTLHAGIDQLDDLEAGQKTNLLIIMALSIICTPVICKRILMILFHIPAFNL